MRDQSFVSSKATAVMLEICGAYGQPATTSFDRTVRRFAISRWSSTPEVQPYGRFLLSGLDLVYR